MPDLTDYLALGRLGGNVPTLSDLTGRERRRRKRLKLRDDDPGDLAEQIRQRIREAPAEDVEDQPHGALQYALEILDYPRNVIANLVNAATGARARPASKRRFGGLQKIGGGDLLRAAGLAFDPNTTSGKVGNFMAGFLGDVALDPLTYATLGTGAILGTAGKKIGQQVLTRAGVKAAERASAALLERAGQKASRGVGDALQAGEAAAAGRQRLLERLGEQAQRRAWRAAKAGGDPEAAGRLKQTLSPLAKEYAATRGRERLLEIAARQTARKSPELVDRNAIGLSTLGLREFDPLGLPATLASAATSLVSPAAGAAIARGYEAIRPASKLLLNPLSLVPEAGVTLVTRKQLGNVAEKLGLGRLKAAAQASPVAGRLLRRMSAAGRALRSKFVTEPAPPRAGDPLDQQRYEAEKFIRWTDQRVAQRQRALALDEPKKLRAWINAAAKESGLPRETVGDVIADVAERLGSYQAGKESGEQLAESTWKIVQAVGGTPQQAEKLVRYVAGKAGVDLGPAWHGSPHDFERFSTEKIGTGEGAQAFGHGLYFASDKEVAKHYQMTLAGRSLFVDGRQIKLNEIEQAEGLTDAERNVLRMTVHDAGLKALPGTLREQAKFYRGLATGWARTPEESERWAKLAEAAEGLAPRVSAGGNLYYVDLKPGEDEYLLWNEPLSKQPERVREALRQAGFQTVEKPIPLKLQEVPGPINVNDAGPFETLLRVRPAPEGWTPDKGAVRPLREAGALRGRWYLFDHEKATGYFLRAVDSREEALRWLRERGDSLPPPTLKTGEEAYNELARSQAAAKSITLGAGPTQWSVPMQHDDAAASAFLRKLGVRGIKYLDGSSRGKGAGNYNYVIFDDADVEILRKGPDLAPEAPAPPSPGPPQSPIPGCRASTTPRPRSRASGATRRSAGMERVAASPAATAWTNTRHTMPRGSSRRRCVAMPARDASSKRG